MTIRVATVDDLPACVAMGLRFAASVYAGVIVVNPEAIHRLGEWLIREGVIFVAERDGEPVGMMGLCVLPHPMSGQRTAFESFWWVNEDARGLGMRLFKLGEAWARDQGAEMMQVVAPDARVERLYERLGYQKVETGFHRALGLSPSMRQSPHVDVEVAVCPL